LNTVIEGRCWTCGDHITVYQVIPESRWTMDELDGDAMGNWVFEALEDEIAGVEGGFKRLGYEIIIAGKDFGCGSKSVEHPMAALKGAGIKLIIAESFSRYSYRNALNLALPVLICPGITGKVHKDNQIAVDIMSGIITNQTTGEDIQANGLGAFATSIISAGGLIKYAVARRDDIVE
jgi:3-isopropylmalate/(R)-2-methylmalate dehydratase small subunit